MRRFNETERSHVRLLLAKKSELSEVPSHIWRIINGKTGLLDHVGDFLDAQEDGDEEGTWNTLWRDVSPFFHTEKERLKSLPTDSMINSVSGREYLVSTKLPSEGGPPSPSRRIGGHQAELEPSELEPKEDALVSAMNAFYAFNASRYQPVTNFRRDYTEGRVLSDTEFERFVSSPALRVFSLAQLHEWGMTPLEASDATFIGNACYFEGDYEILAIRFEVSGRIETVRVVAASARIMNPLMGHFPGVDGERTPVMVYPGSVLDETRQLWEMLTDHYPWDAFQALCFLLLGDALKGLQIRTWFQPVHVCGVNEKFPLYTELVPAAITMTIPLGISPSTVERIYRDQMERKLGQQMQPTNLRNLILFRFVLAKKDELGISGAGTHAEWREMCKDWNERVGSFKSDWKFEKSSRTPSSRFREEYERVEKRLFKPCYHRQQRKGNHIITED